MNSYEKSSPRTDSLLLRQREVSRLLGISRSTLFRWERVGNFPSRVQIGPHSIAWRTSDIHEWLRTRAGAPSVTEPRDT